MEMHKDKKKLKICFVRTIPTSYVLPLLKILCDDDRWDLHVYFCGVSHSDRSWELDLNHPKIKVLKGYATKPKGRQWFTNHINPTIALSIIKENYDAVIVCGYAVITFQIAMLVSKILRIPYIINTETHVYDKNNAAIGLLKKYLRGIFLNHASGFLVTGTRVKNHLQKLGVKKDKIFIFPNTPDVGLFTAGAERARENKDAIKSKYKINSEKVVLFVGRLVDVKNVENLVSAYSLLPKQIKEVTSLVIVGDGVLRAKLEKQKIDKKLNNLVFLGHKNGNELVELYGISDLFVLVSSFEPWGVVVNEAAASGLPLVLSREVGATDDLLVNGENGIIVESNSVIEISNSIVKILSDNSLSRKMGERSLSIIQDWSYQRCENGFIEMLSSIQSKKSTNNKCYSE